MIRQNTYASGFPIRTMKTTNSVKSLKFDKNLDEKDPRIKLDFSSFNGMKLMRKRVREKRNARRNCR